MDKKLIKLTEQDLHRIVKESVNRVLNEDKEPYVRPTQPFGVNRYIIDKLKEVRACLDQIGNFPGYVEFERNANNGVPKHQLSNAWNLINDVIADISRGNITM